jgi:chorismate mutase
MTTSTVDGADAVTSIEDGRNRLDAIDGALLDLLGKRRTVSRQVQELRIQAGESRVSHTRENEIIRRWSDALGDTGPDLALAVLAHCRGRT